MPYAALFYLRSSASSRVQIDNFPPCIDRLVFEKAWGQEIAEQLMPKKSSPPLRPTLSGPAPAAGDPRLQHDVCCSSSERGQRPASRSPARRHPFPGKRRLAERRRARRGQSGNSHGHCGAHLDDVGVMATIGLSTDAGRHATAPTGVKTARTACCRGRHGRLGFKGGDGIFARAGDAVRWALQESETTDIRTCQRGGYLR